MGEQLQGLPILQAYGAEGRARERFDAEQAVYLREMDRSLLLRGAASPTVELLGVTGLALALAVGARAVAREPPLAAHLLSYVGAVMLMYGPLKSLSGTFAQVLQGLGAAERLLELEALPRETDTGLPVKPLRRAVRFEEVRVRYDEGRQEALSGLTLEVPAGKTAALVGASGAGKSTTFAGLLGFVAPSAGRILWDEVDVQTLRPSGLRPKWLGWPRSRCFSRAMSATRCCSGAPTQATPRCGRPCALRMRMVLSGPSPAASRRKSASAALGCQEDNGSVWPLPGPSSASRRFFFWTSPPARSTPPVGKM